MINRNKILGIIEYRLKDIPYSVIQRKYVIGSSTISNVMKKYNELKVPLEELRLKEPHEVERLFYPPLKRKDPSLFPDFEKVHKRMTDPKSKVTLTYLWCEYKKDHPDGYEYTQYHDDYVKYVKETYGSENVRMVVERTPGETIYIDWVGDQPKLITDSQTGELKKIHILTTTVGYSSLRFAKAYLNEKMESFIDGVSSAIKYYGYVSKKLCPDNLKAAVTKHTKDELLLTAAFSDLESFYDVIVIPPPPRKPRGKASVEKEVQTEETYIIEELKKQPIYTNIDEINAKIIQIIDEMNNKVWRGQSFSRRYLFENFDKPNMRELNSLKPFYLYEYKIFNSVPNNYHLEFDEHYYSVPYTMYGKSAIVRANFYSVSISNEYNQFVCEHKRVYAAFPKYITNDDHMPAKHKFYQTVNTKDGNYYRAWARNRYGEDMALIINKILALSKHEETMYASCNGLLHYCSQAPSEIVKQLAKDCRELKTINYTSFKRMLQARVNNTNKDEVDTNESVINHENIRGKEEFV